MLFKASLDNLAKGMSIAILILFLGIGASMVYNLDPTNPNEIPLWAAFLIESIFLGIYLFCYLYAPQAYLVESDRIKIIRPIDKVDITFNNISSIRLVDKSEIKTLIRTFGVGGLFGYYGHYYSSSLGKLTLYNTQRKNLLLIEQKVGRKILLSPDDTRMVETILAKLKNS
jgi:hypothetical protein